MLWKWHKGVWIMEILLYFFDRIHSLANIFFDFLLCLWPKLLCTFMFILMNVTVDIHDKLLSFWIFLRLKSLANHCTKSNTWTRAAKLYRKEDQKPQLMQFIINHKKNHMNKNIDHSELHQSPAQCRLIAWQGHSQKIIVTYDHNCDPIWQKGTYI